MIHIARIIPINIDKMNKFFILCTISVFFGVSLIVSGVPISTNILSSSATSNVLMPMSASSEEDGSDENSTISNGTHKEL